MSEYSMYETTARNLRTSTLFLPLLVLAGCDSGGGGGGGGDGAFVVRTAGPAVSATTPLLVSGFQAAFLGSEANTAGGTNWNEANGDTDTTDSILCTIDMQTETVQVLAAAVDPTVLAERALVYVNSTLFAVVSEAADTFDWNGDLDMTDRVLVYARPGDSEPTYLADLPSGVPVPFRAGGDRLVWQTPDAPSGAGRTNLAFTTVTDPGGAPSAPASVATDFVDPGNDGLSCRILYGESGMIFCSIDEDGEGDLNGDGDATDEFILALIDGFAATPSVVVVGHALAEASAPLAATRRNADYLVAFLASEAADDVNYNTIALLGMSWLPPQCNNLNDNDLDDEILFWLRFEDFVTDPISNAPRNTGLVGSGFVYTLDDDWVGTISLEADEGPGPCDLNDDGDTNDRIFRWTRAMSGELPPVDSSKLHAIASVPGGTGGVTTLDNDLWVIVVNEGADGRNIDGDTMTDFDLIGVHDPALSGTVFTFDHGSGAFIEASWMAPDTRTASRFLAAITEASVDLDRNGDGDKTDSVPTFPVEGAPRELDFPGLGVAVSPANAGIVTAGGYGFYRIRELDQGTDYNNDGDMNDVVLQRVSLSGSSAPTTMGLAQDLVRPIIEPGPIAAARAFAWIAHEAQQGLMGIDLNGDGDGADYVVRYARLP